MSKMIVHEPTPNHGLGVSSEKMLIVQHHDNQYMGIVRIVSDCTNTRFLDYELGVFQSQSFTHSFRRFNRFI